MKILVIGNGFDLAHGLPTKYTDFLEFSGSFLEYDIKRGEKICWDEWFREKPIRRYIMRLFEEQSNEGDSFKDHKEDRIRIRNNARKTIQNLKELLSNNVWLEYFLEKRDEMLKKGQENWIDFEEEISKIIQSLDKDFHNKDKGYNIDSDIEDLSNDFLKKRFIVSKQQTKNVCSMEASKNSFRYIRDILLEDLNKLIQALEIYLVMCVEGRRCDALSEIENIQPDYVLSFNYTHTYQIAYSTNAKVDYIHGSVNSTQEKKCNNMVLGIDEYLSQKRKNRDIDFISFKKYYQRIHKGTGCRYKDWIAYIKKQNEVYLAKQKYLDRKKNKKDLDKRIYTLQEQAKRYIPEINPPKHEIHIFGHSLDITDGDIVRELILNDYVYTTIYYLDENVMGRQIANLVKVIGQDELIKRTGGKNATIKFKRQQSVKKKE